MHTLKFSLLFSLLLFGAYSEYKAETAVGQIKSEEVKRTRYNRYITHEDVDFMDQAIKLSGHTLGRDDSSACGSVVVKKGMIVGKGWNKTRQQHDPSAHAVVEAIRDACINLSSDKLPGCYIYASARPCSMCLSLIHLTGIEKLFYSVPGEDITSWKMNSRGSSDFHEWMMPPLERQIPAIPIARKD